MITIAKKYQEEIKQVCQTAAARNAIQAFENIYIHADNDGTIKIKAGDSMVEITRTLVAESFESGFETTVNASKFLQAFNACPNDVKIIVKDKMTIKSGKRRFTLPIIDAESYPAYPELSETQKVGDAQAVKSLLDECLWAVDRNDARAMFKGVHLGNDAVGTDGKKMCVISGDIQSNLIVPVDSVNKIPDIEGEVFASDSMLVIKGDGVEFKTKLIDARFPDYTRAIPKCTKTVDVDMAEFKSAVKAAQITANSQFKTVVLSFGEDSTVCASSADRREDSSIGFECEPSEPFEFALNSTYLIEALNQLTLPSVQLQFSDAQLMIEEGGKKLVISSVKL